MCALMQWQGPKVRLHHSHTPSPSPTGASHAGIPVPITCVWGRPQGARRGRHLCFSRCCAAVCQGAPGAAGGPEEAVCAGGGKWKRMGVCGVLGLHAIGCRGQVDIAARTPNCSLSFLVERITFLASPSAFPRSPRQHLRAALASALFVPELV